MSNKKLSVITCLFLSIFVLAACSNTGISTTPTDTSASVNNSQAASQTTTAAPEPPAEISWYFSSQGTTYQEFDFSKCWFMDIISEMANVKFKEIINPPHADRVVKYNMLLASGEVPDLSTCPLGNVDINKYGKEGAFIKTDSYIQNSSIISKIYDKAQREYIKADDGNTYAIWGYPSNADFGTDCGFAYRADLLEKYNIKTPETLDEWVNAMRVIKTNIPDSIPYSCVALGQYYEFMFSPYNIGFGQGILTIFDDTAKTFTNAFGTENLEKAVTFGKMLYDEGLLDKEFMTHTKNDYTNKIYSRNMLIIPKNRGGINNFLSRFPDNNVKEAKIMPAYYSAAEGITMPDGVYKHYGQLIGFPMTVSSTSKEPEACIRVIEALLSDEVNDLAVYGREGFEYQVIDGVKTAIEPASTESGWRLAFGVMFGVNTSERMNYNADAIIDSIDASADVKKAYKAEFNERMQMIEKKIFVASPRADKYIEPLSDELSLKRTESSEYQRATIARFIMGEITIEQFRAEAEKIVANDAPIIEALNKNLADAVAKYGLK